MAYDGLLTKAVCSEIKQLLISSKIDKINQPESDQFVFTVRGSTEKKKLLIDISSSGSRIHFTAMEYENPKEAPTFCMVLRKHIQGGRISDVCQYGNERIIIFLIETINEMGYSCVKKLVAETMGKYSNLILLDAQNDRIIDAAKRITVDMNRYRQILPGMTYVLPPTANLSNTFGYGPAAKAAVEMGSDPSENLPRVWVDEKGTVKDVHVIDLCQYSGVYTPEIFESVSEALEYYYKNKFETNRTALRAAEFARQLSSIIDKQNTKKAKLLEEIKRSENSDIYRIKAELLNCNLHLVKPGACSIDVISYYDNSKLTIELDKRFSAAKNAQNYYKKYAKLKASKKEKLQQLEICDEELAYLSMVYDQIFLAEMPSEIDALKDELHRQGFIRIAKSDKRRNEKPHPREFILSSGLRVYVGRSNTENDYISFKAALKTDYWFHTKDIHGSHVILKTEGSEPSSDDIYEAAAIAAYYSKGRDSDKVPVDYLPVRYLKKPAGARPGMVIFTNNRTVWVKSSLPQKTT